MARKPRFAGTFYESNFNELDKQIAGCFEHKMGPGALPVNKREATIKAVVAPHAGYPYSGPCAAWSYKAVGEAEFPDLYIIIGPNHHGGGTFISGDAWETPLGSIRIDQEFARRLQEKTKLPVNEDVHDKEHSIEVQLPFLQFVSKDKMHELKFLPLMLDHDVDLKKLALDLKEVIVEAKKKVVFIISSDFTHFGRRFGYIPFGSEVKKNIYALDEGAINLIKEHKPDELLAYADEKLATICGIAPIALLLYTLKKGIVELEQYYTSADITDGDYKNSVSYASLVFR